MSGRSPNCFLTTTAACSALPHSDSTRNSRSRVDADDIMQEAYLNAAQRLGRILHDSPQSFFIWLRMILSQTMTDVHRRHLGAQMRDASREAVKWTSTDGDSTSYSLTHHLVGHLTSPQPGGHSGMNSPTGSTPRSLT